MKGVTHEVWVESGQVRMANNDDSLYVQTFQTAQEVDTFIQELEKAKREAFGEGVKLRFEDSGNTRYPGSVCPSVNLDVVYPYHDCKGMPGDPCEVCGKELPKLRGA